MSKPNPTNAKRKKEVTRRIRDSLEAIFRVLLLEYGDALIRNAPGIPGRMFDWATQIGDAAEGNLYDGVFSCELRTILWDFSGSAGFSNARKLNSNSNNPNSNSVGLEFDCDLVNELLGSKLGKPASVTLRVLPRPKRSPKVGLLYDLHNLDNVDISDLEAIDAKLKEQLPHVRAWATLRRA